MAVLPLKQRLLLLQEQLLLELLRVLLQEQLLLVPPLEKQEEPPSHSVALAPVALEPASVPASEQAPALPAPAAEAGQPA